MSEGEERIWETLASLEPPEVCRRTDASFDSSSGLYAVESFGKKFHVSPAERKLINASPDGEVFLSRLGYFFRLSVIGYLTLSKDVAPSGRLANPLNMKSGQLFFRGSHVLPLDRLAERYGEDREGFLKKGREFGGNSMGFGHASLRLMPLPRIPVTQILWLADDEFPARADLLFDSSCEVQLPIDVIWAVAMLSILVMF